MNDIKRARLRHMQRLNLALLGASLVLLTASVRYQALWPGLRWLQAFAEAAAIGAIADWYAVVALFRRPLGLPIPHTAIIQSNQHRIADKLGEFIEGHFLEAAPVDAKLRQIDFGSFIADWLRDRKRSTDLARF